MIIWGESGTEGPDTGSRYEPATNSWTTISTAGEPGPRFGHKAIWTGLEMIVWGSGEFPTNTGGRYNPQLNSWVATSVGANVPIAREYNSLAWTGTEMLVWGGDDGSLYLKSGARYRPDLDSWSPMSTVGAPTARHKHTAVWTGSEMIVWGGFPPLGGTNSGGRYDPVSDMWTPTGTAGSVAEPRYEHTAVWTGREMIIWGGLLGFLNTGGRYDPVADSWLQTSTGSGVPSPRRYHTAIWTGKEMIVWGGVAAAGSAHKSGGRYDPVADAWMPTSLDANTPSGRIVHSAIWTGIQMIIWGGEGGLGTQTGGKYCAGPCTTPVAVAGLSVTIDALPGETLLEWQPVAGASGYDVVKGGLGALQSSGGDFTTSTSACLTENNSGERTTDWGLPPAGDGVWYLVRAVNCGAGSYDSGGASQAASRDAEIQASTVTCQ